MMILVGLTGGIGSGKSTVARLFRELGASVVDADEVAREVVELGAPALSAIRAKFGSTVLAEDGSLDREALAARVFSDDSARAELNAIVHPAVAARTKELIEEARARGERLLVYDVPLLFESELESMFDAIVVVSASEEVRRRRLADRNGWTDEEISARIDAQLPLEDKIRRADFVIENDGSRLETRRQVEGIVPELLGVSP